MDQELSSQIVGMNVRNLRVNAGLSLPELSSRLEKNGVELKDMIIGRIERGVRKASVDDLTALAVALETSPAELLTLPPFDGKTLTGVPLGYDWKDVNNWAKGRAKLDHLSLAEYAIKCRKDELRRLEVFEGDLARDLNDRELGYYAARSREAVRVNDYYIRKHFEALGLYADVESIDDIVKLHESNQVG